MQTWVLFAIAAYTLNAVNGVLDKFMLSKRVGEPLAYAFYSSLTSLLVVVLIPFGVKFLDLKTLVFALLSGISFSVALYFYFQAIKASSVSRILPIEGGFIPVFTLILAAVFLNEQLTIMQYVAFIFLVIGAIVISVKKEAHHLHPVALMSAVLAAASFAISFTSLKFVYMHTNFLSGLFWSRMGMGFVPLVILLTPLRKRLVKVGEKSSNSSRGIFVFSKVAAACSTLLENWAISLGSVSLVKALQGTQYVFLLILTSVLSLYFSKILKEKITTAILVQKLIAIGIISFGLILLTK